MNTIYNDDLTINCFEVILHIREVPKCTLGSCEIDIKT